MKTFLFGVIFGLVMAFFFMNHKEEALSHGETEDLFPLKPDLTPEEKDKEKEK